MTKSRLKSLIFGRFAPVNKKKIKIYKAVCIQPSLCTVDVQDHVVRVVYLIIATSLSTALSFLVKHIFHLFGVSCAGASEVSSKNRKNRTIHGMLKVHMGA